MGGSDPLWEEAHRRFSTTDSWRSPDMYLMADLHPGPAPEGGAGETRRTQAFGGMAMWQRPARLTTQPIPAAARTAVLPPPHWQTFSPDPKAALTPGGPEVRSRTFYPAPTPMKV